MATSVVAALLVLLSMGAEAMQMGVAARDDSHERATADIGSASAEELFPESLRASSTSPEGYSCASGSGLQLYRCSDVRGSRIVDTEDIVAEACSADPRCTGYEYDVYESIPKSGHLCYQGAYPGLSEESRQWKLCKKTVGFVEGGLKYGDVTVQDMYVGGTCVVEYDRPYADHTTWSRVFAGPRQHYEHILVGALKPGEDRITGKYAVAAIDYISLAERLQQLSHQALAGSPGGLGFQPVFWNNYKYQVFGFSNTSAVQVPDGKYADTLAYSKPCEHRLSWPVTGSRGGFSAGCTTDLEGNTEWHKVVHYCKGGRVAYPLPTPAPTASPTLVPTSSPSSAPTSSPTLAPTSSPTPAATPRPTALPSAMPATSMNVAGASGDPHMVNILSQRFDLMKPGNYTLLQIPKSSGVHESLMLVEAKAERLGGHCADIYLVEVNVTGRWAREVGPGGLRYSVAQLAAEGWVRLGKVDLKVVRGRTAGGLDYLNVFVRHLGKSGHAVGGLLGDSDHTEASKPGGDCRAIASLVSFNTGNEEQPRSERSVAEVTE